MRAYSGVGRIAWTIPATFPHFTMGPRIKCKDEDREECEIQVRSRDITKPAAERQRQLVDEMRPFIGHSVEGVARIQTAAGDTNVVYVTLTAPGTSVDFRFLTRGYAVKGFGPERPRRSSGCWMSCAAPARSTRCPCGPGG